MNRSVVTTFCLVGCLGASVSALAAASSPSKSAAEKATPKTHTLFMGADISVDVDGELHRVEDIEGESFVVVAGGKKKLVSMRKNPLLIKISESLKVTNRSATINKLKGERAYTPANNPHHKFARQAGSASGAAAAVDFATMGLNNAQANLSALQSSQANNPGADLSGQISAAQESASAAARGLDNASAFAASNLANPGYYAGLLQAELSKELFDALEVSFEVSSDRRLERPYFVVVTRYREKEEKPGATRNWVYAQALDPIEAKPRKVHVLRGGFPLGFDMESYQVYLYDGGVEIPTTVSRKRVELTSDEAFQYSVIDYVSRHKGATLSARPHRLEPDNPLVTALGPEQRERRFYVPVSREGRPAGAFLDQKCTRELDDAALRTLAQELRFNPALDKGKPVDTVAAITIGDLLKR